MARKTGSHAGITGPRIRLAARTLFARHGYAAVSMRQIAAEVGVQAGALYTYTPDKQALLHELMFDFLENGLLAWEAGEKRKAPLDRLEDFTRFFMNYNLDRCEEVFIAYMELRNLTSENFTVIEALRRRYEDVVDEILQAGRRDGIFDLQDTRVTTFAILTMLTGVTAWYRPEGRLSRDEIIEVYWDLVQRTVQPGSVLKGTIAQRALG